jgi:hypothetical protein
VDRQEAGDGMTYHRLAILTDEQVTEIRQRYASGGISQRLLAQDFGVSANTILLCVNGETYKHLPVIGHPPRHQASGPAPTQRIIGPQLRELARTPLPERRMVRSILTARQAVENPGLPYERRNRIEEAVPLPDPTKYTGIRAKLAARRLAERTQGGNQ